MHGCDTVGHRLYVVSFIAHGFYVFDGHGRLSVRFFFLMIRRPPRSTLFPTRRSSDLPLPRHIHGHHPGRLGLLAQARHRADRKSTRLNSSHQIISYAVFCLKKKKQYLLLTLTPDPPSPPDSAPTPPAADPTDPLQQRD